MTTREFDSKPTRIFLFSNGEPLRDAQGVQASIDVLPASSRRGRAATEEIARRVPARDMDERKESLRLIAALTVGWHLVTVEGHVIELPANKLNAFAIY